MCYFCNLKKDQFYVKEKYSHTRVNNMYCQNVCPLEKHLFLFVIKILPRLAVPRVWTFSYARWKSPGDLLHNNTHEVNNTVHTFKLLIRSTLCVSS